MSELLDKVIALLDSGLPRKVLAEVLIDVIARSLGRLGGRPLQSGSAHQQSIKSDVSANIKADHSSSGSVSDLRLFPDPDSSQPIEEIVGRDEPEAPPQGFAEFWSLYPRRVGKAAAIRAWRRLKPPITKVRETLEWQRRDPWWVAGNAPHPATWLNQGRWKDERPAAPAMSEREARGAVAAAAFAGEEGNGHGRR